MDRLLYLDEIPIEMYSGIDRLRHFSSMVDTNRFLLVTLLALGIVFIVGLTIGVFYIFRDKLYGNRKSALIIIFSGMLLFAVSESVLNTYLPSNNYELITRNVEEGDTIYRDEYLTGRYLLRGDKVYRLNGYGLEEKYPSQIVFK